MMLVCSFVVFMRTFLLFSHVCESHNFVHLVRPMLLAEERIWNVSQSTGIVIEYSIVCIRLKWLHVILQCHRHGTDKHISQIELYERQIAQQMEAHVEKPSAQYMIKYDYDCLSLTRCCLFAKGNITHVTHAVIFAMLFDVGRVARRQRTISRKHWFQYILFLVCMKNIFIFLQYQ